MAERFLLFQDVTEVYCTMGARGEVHLLNLTEAVAAVAKPGEIWSQEADLRLDFMHEIGIRPAKMPELLRWSLGVRVTRRQVELRIKKLRQAPPASPSITSGMLALVPENIPDSVIKSARRQCRLRHSGRCMVCGTKRNFTVHHKVPLTYGGSWAQENLDGVCEHCHKAIHNINGAYEELESEAQRQRVDGYRTIIENARKLYRQQCPVKSPLEIPGPVTAQPVQA
ncbi:MAG: HNH endonuclease [candidate division Kazan bacterium GW2011_GWA1_50_15]|uniref:HNH endonuclease n=2 Tax=Bacteria division Kazan-3B-28 TaxID=1798534 RepID=A0A0G1ZG45_UNCK3|nr:MAG: HNH endonuclease [candidate division Kazan bacterium GW2011_GWA1_50_15]KKW25567.1 MAG: HNH endonuclease [candidate division Kazan bacterium GW2011_GWC1_52_13]KKW26872.1 MAG: HNH endonuclease [candidate division Kazan bacterium GW2011_GWB1_52_7]HAV65867.1 hypothetical protein [Patescibacteria group bacterium]HCR42724.1 hypothetical protein [Patescibacteria group bacterium]